MPSALWAPSKIVSGSCATTSNRPGTSVPAAATRTASSSSAPRNASAAARGEREVPALEGPGGEHRHARVGGRHHQVRRALGADALGDGQRVGVQVGADDERAAGLHDVGLLLGDRRDRRAEPARVLQRDAREHLDLGADDVRRVVAAAEAGLDHRDLRRPARASSS